MSYVKFSQVGESRHSTAIVDTRYNYRWLDAWGDVEKSVVDNTWLADEFVVTATGTSPITASVLPSAVALVTSGGSDFDGDNIQLVGSRFKLTAGQPCYFGAKLTMNEATQSDLVVGLFGVDTTLTAASSTHAFNVAAGGVGFTKLDAVTACNFVSYATTTVTNTAAALTMDVAAHVYEFYYDGAKIHGYVDNVLKGTFSTSLPSVVLTPSINFRTGSAAAKTLTIHWMRAFQIRS
jgi:hypothetical protein